MFTKWDLFCQLWFAHHYAKPGCKYACFKIQHLFPTRQRKIVNHSNVFNPCTFLHTFLKLLIFTWFLGEEGTKGKWFMTLPYFNSCLHSMIEDALDFLCLLVATPSGEKSNFDFPGSCPSTGFWSKKYANWARNSCPHQSSTNFKGPMPVWRYIKQTKSFKLKK